jgi:hypothetical protein
MVAAAQQAVAELKGHILASGYIARNPPEPAPSLVLEGFVFVTTFARSFGWVLRGWGEGGCHGRIRSPGKVFITIAYGLLETPPEFDQ